jgi:hypothetical protein
VPEEAMKISSARYEGDKLILTADPSARRFVYDFKPGEYEIVKAKKKRSLDANAYCWVLCTKISESLGIPKEEIYRQAIKEGNEYTPMPIKESAVEDFSRIWAGHGIGWFTEVVGDSKIHGYKLVFAYHGSSVYDTKQMSQLIDRLVQDAKALDIETLPPDKLEQMIGAWDEKED